MKEEVRHAQEEGGDTEDKTQNRLPETRAQEDGEAPEKADQAACGKG